MQEKAINALRAGRRAAGPALSKRAWLQRRNFNVHVDDRVGKSGIITAGAVGVQGGGFYCPVTKVTLKDSQSYFDHINGRKYQQALDIGMRVERSTASDVRSKLKSMINRGSYGASSDGSTQRAEAGVRSASATGAGSRSKRKRKRDEQRHSEQDSSIGGMMDAE